MHRTQNGPPQEHRSYLPPSYNPSQTQYSTKCGTATNGAPSVTEKPPLHEEPEVVGWKGSDS